MVQINQPFSFPLKAELSKEDKKITSGDVKTQKVGKSKIGNNPSQKNTKLYQSKIYREDQYIRFKENEYKIYEQTGQGLGGTKRLHLDKIDLIVPLKPEEVLKEYVKVKQKIAEVIKIDEPIAHRAESKKWMNTSRSISELLKDARSISDEFANMIEGLASSNHGKACFGPNRQFMLKSNESLERKAKDDAILFDITLEESIAGIGDSIRGTVVVKTPQDVTLFISELQRESKSKGWDVTFKNLWNEDRVDGYVGVHARMKIRGGNGNEVLAELQIHLPQIYNGDDKCVKEFSHKTYEYAREAKGPKNEKGEREPLPPSYAGSSSLLQYCSHLKQITV